MKCFCFRIHNVARPSNRGALSRVLKRVVLVAALLASGLTGFAEDAPNQAVPVTAGSKAASVVTDILVVLDATSSMAYQTASETGASRLDLGRVVTSAVLDVAPEGIRLGVLTLRDDVSELRPLQPMSAADRTVIRRGVDRLFPFGEGDLVSCFQRIIEKVDAGATPLVILVTDGSDYRAGSANLAAKQMKERFGGRMKFVLVGICKAGEVADRLQTLGTFAGGDSLSFTSENDIPAGLATVRAVCDEVRRHRARQQKLTEQQRDDLLMEKDRLRGELTASTGEVDKLTREVKSLQRISDELTKDVATKKSENDVLAGQLHQQTHQLNTADEEVTRLQKDVGKLTEQRDSSTKAAADARKVAADLKNEDIRKLARISQLTEKATTGEKAIAGLNTDLDKFKNSWTSSLMDHETFGIGMFLLMLLGSGGGGSAIATKLLSAKFGLLGTGLGETRSEILEEQKKKAEEASQKLDKIVETTGKQFEALRAETGQQFAGITETTGQLFEKLREESGREFAGVTAATERKLQDVSQALSTTLTDVSGRLNHVEEVAATTHADVVERLTEVRTDGQKQSQELKATLERNVDQLRGAVVEKVDTPVRLMVDSLKELENRLAACVTQATARLDERLPATVAAPLQASLAEVRRQIDVVTTQASRFEESIPERIRSTMQTELAELRSTFESGREDVDQMKEALRQDVERTAGETIQRVGEVSTNLIAPALEGIREIRTELSRQAQHAESLAKETRDSVDRVSREVDQIPERMKVTGKKLSNVQQTLDSIRDQIEQLRHHFEAGLHNTERRQLEQQSRNESRNAEQVRVTAIRDEMLLNLRTEFAQLCAELKEISPTLSTPLSRMEEKLQSILRELGRERQSGSGHSDWMDSVKARLDEVASLAESMRQESQTATESQGPAPGRKAETPVETEGEASPETANPPVASNEDSAESQSNEDAAKSSRRTAETKKRNQWNRELRMLPGLGRKSADTLVDFGVNTIRELSNLGAGQKAVIRELGGRLRDIDEWVRAARKVRLLNDHLELGRKEAIEFVVSKTWPESFLRLPESELSELSIEFPEILDWVRESR